METLQLCDDCMCKKTCTSFERCVLLPVPDENPESEVLPIAAE